jgi:hypothetical protein
VLDCNPDPTFAYEDLGNSLRKIRSDMKIPVQFDERLTTPMRARKRRCAVAHIGYSSVDGNCPDGVLIYLKPMYLGSEPPDVQSYHSGHGGFPHESTSDERFDESQTESHRMLGLHTINEVCAYCESPTLEDLLMSAQKYIQSEPAAPATTNSQG